MFQLVLPSSNKKGSKVLAQFYQKEAYYMSGHAAFVVEKIFRGAVKKTNSIFKDIVQIGGREVNPISKN